MEKLVLALRMISHLSPLVVLVTGWRSRGWIWWCAIAAFCSDSVMFLLESTHRSEEWVANVFVATEFVLFSAYYRRALDIAAITPVAALLTAGYAAHTLWRGPMELNLAGGAVFHLVYILYALAGFKRSLHFTPTHPLQQSPPFWTTCALLLHVSSANLYFLFYQELVEMTLTRRTMWKVFFLSANILKYVLLAVAMRIEFRLRWKSA